MITTKYKPNYAVHPGEVLEEDLEALEISQKKLSEITGIHKTVINEIIKGKRNINAETSIKLGRAFKYPDDFYFNLQNTYDLTIARLKMENESESEIVVSLDEGVSSTSNSCAAELTESDILNYAIELQKVVEIEKSKVKRGALLKGA